jgi:hypothetical protein
LATLFIGVAVLVVAATPDPGAFMVGVSASEANRTTAAPFFASQPSRVTMRISDHDGRRQVLVPGSTLGAAVNLAATTDNDHPIANERFGVGSRGAFHAGDRSPFAVSNRRDLRLDLMEMMAWRSRQDPAFLGSCLFC